MNPRSLEKLIYDLLYNGVAQKGSCVGRIISLPAKVRWRKYHEVGDPSVRGGRSYTSATGHGRHEFGFFGDPLYNQVLETSN
jgi:hypothetical protein